MKTMEFFFGKKKKKKKKKEYKREPLETLLPLD